MAWDDVDENSKRLRATAWSIHRLRIMPPKRLLRLAGVLLLAAMLIAGITLGVLKFSDPVSCRIF